MEQKTQDIHQTMGKSKKPLSQTHPELSKEWHPTLNAELKPVDVTAGSDKKVWWKCQRGVDHEWVATVKSRANGNGCAICANRKVVISNCLATLFPDISNQWHQTKNKELTPFDIAPGSHTKVWWKCAKGIDHEWIASIGERTGNKTNCPVCQGLKVVKSNCLATTHPDLCKEFNHKKNTNISPYKIIAGSAKKIWWKCDKEPDHEWLASPNNRTSKKSGCPFCANHKVSSTNNLEFLNTELSNEWHPTLNGTLNPSNFTLGSSKKVWWKCSNGYDHIWQARICDRSGLNRNGCPICSGRTIGFDNSLQNKYPEISKMWNYNLNGKTKPEEVISNSHKRFWWKCDMGDDHVWKASPNALIQNSKKNSSNGCPVCRGLKVVRSNSLTFLRPDISAEWHIDLNQHEPHSYSINSGKKVWWKCKNNPTHEWSATISNRTNGSNCPYCDLTPQSRQELTITFELLTIFKNIDPKGLKAKIGGRMRSIDIYISDLNLCIEFDGSYWHKGKLELDKIKSEMLINDGYRVIRVREEPLKHIHDTDIISRIPFNGKKVTDDILSMILHLFDVDDPIVSRINEYHAKKELQNEKGLDKYIESILKDKVKNRLY